MSLPPLVKLSVPHIRFDCYRNLLLLPFKLVCFAWIVTSSVSNIYTRYTALFSKCLTFGNLVTLRAFSFLVLRGMVYHSDWPSRYDAHCTSAAATVQKAMRGELRSTRALRCSPHTVPSRLIGELPSSGTNGDQRWRRGAQWFCPWKRTASVWTMGIETEWLVNHLFYW